MPVLYHFDLKNARSVPKFAGRLTVNTHLECDGLYKIVVSVGPPVL